MTLTFTLRGVKYRADTLVDLSFTVSLNEAQRLVLVRALAATFIVDPTLDDADDMDGGRLLHDMLVDMPNQERASPGCVHGFFL